MNKHWYFSFVIALQGFVLAKVELLLLFSFLFMLVQIIQQPICGFHFY
jgi:hypothetical protein